MKRKKGKHWNVNDYARNNRLYQYERYKNYLSLPNREAEVRMLTKDLKV